MIRTIKTFVGLSIVLLTLPMVSVAAPIVFSATDSIQATVDAFRAALGEPNNGNAPGPLSDGRREINWDGGGSTATAPAPNTFAGFQTSRGALFTTSGTGFVQAPPDGLATTFSNPTYNSFVAFSPVRLFSAVGSNITDATFTLPGNPAVDASINGFGVVFSDVDLADSATIQFYNLDDNPIGPAYSANPFNDGLSFIGVVFDAGEKIGRVKITSGSVAPGPNDGPGSDIVMMDDFIYSEPQAIPEPTTLLLFSTALAGMAIRRRFRGRA
ncbi:MAG TPA: PEP-CTERM sorting domain-containing protein [Bryobacteraceae bacterium]|nr:PEP-CTERM sorting domain-containing protein [Bryobacteraceae bacterium]